MSKKLPVRLFQPLFGLFMAFFMSFLMSGAITAQDLAPGEFLPYYLPGSRESLPRLNLQRDSQPQADPLAFRKPDFRFPNPHSRFRGSTGSRSPDEFPPDDNGGFNFGGSGLGGGFGRGGF